VCVIVLIFLCVCLLVLLPVFILLCMHTQRFFSVKRGGLKEFKIICLPSLRSLLLQGLLSLIYLSVFMFHKPLLFYIVLSEISIELILFLAVSRILITSCR